MLSLKGGIFFAGLVGIAVFISLILIAAATFLAIYYCKKKWVKCCFFILIIFLFFTNDLSQNINFVFLLRKTKKTSTDQKKKIISDKKSSLKNYKRYDYQSSTSFVYKVWHSRYKFQQLIPKKKTYKTKSKNYQNPSSIDVSTASLEKCSQSFFS